VEVGCEIGSETYFVTTALIFFATRSRRERLVGMLDHIKVVWRAYRRTTQRASLLPMRSMFQVSRRQRQRREMSTNTG
jgi:hypothetical protein